MKKRDLSDLNNEQGLVSKRKSKSTSGKIRKEQRKPVQLDIEDHNWLSKLAHERWMGQKALLKEIIEFYRQEKGL